ncbi:hypothetical protein NIES3974_20310 [Calothrix sp. NIES-3974]|nr:hypothetical protein NIES3974_20310 [Calothrix sp. NIES-3974]
MINVIYVDKEKTNNKKQLNSSRVINREHTGRPTAFTDCRLFIFDWEIIQLNHAGLQT